MFQTLDKGFGQMIPQPQYSIKDKYALIHYIRESLVKKNNPSNTSKSTRNISLATPSFRASRETVIELPASGSKPYQKMDFGTALFWTYQVNKGRSPADWNIAQKGIAVRLDKGPEVFPRESHGSFTMRTPSALRLLTKGNSSTGEGLPLTVRMAPTPRSKEKPYSLRPINRQQKPEDQGLGRPKNRRTGRKKVRSFAPLVGSVSRAFSAC